MSAILSSCPECGASFLNGYMLQQHQNFKHSLSTEIVLRGGNIATIQRIDGQLGCPLCDASYICSDTLRRHVHLNHRVDNPLTCWKCGQQFKSRKSVGQHVREAHDPTTRVVFNGQAIPVARTNGVFFCPGCDQRYRNARSLQKHVKKAHLQDCHTTAPGTPESQSTVDSTSCQRCRVVFATPAEYNRNVRNIHQDRVVVRNPSVEPFIVDRVGDYFHCTRCYTALKTPDTLRSPVKGCREDQPRLAARPNADLGQSLQHFAAPRAEKGSDASENDVDTAFEDMEEQCIRLLGTLRRLQRPHPKAVVRLLEAVRETRTRVNKETRPGRRRS